MAGKIIFSPRRKGRKEGGYMENEAAKQIVDAALLIHRALGPGLLESVYETVLYHELKKRGCRCSVKFL
jgi:hypothetical protein